MLSQHKNQDDSDPIVSILVSAFRRGRAIQQEQKESTNAISPKPSEVEKPEETRDTLTHNTPTS
jgi:hypothetical protein